MNNTDLLKQIFHLVKNKPQEFISFANEHENNLNWNQIINNKPLSQIILHYSIKYFHSSTHDIFCFFKEKNIYYQFNEKFLFLISELYNSQNPFFYDIKLLFMNDNIFHYSLQQFKFSHIKSFIIFINSNHYLSQNEPELIDKIFSFENDPFSLINDDKFAGYFSQYYNADKHAAMTPFLKNSFPKLSTPEIIQSIDILLDIHKNKGVLIHLFNDKTLSTWITKQNEKDKNIITSTFLTSLHNKNHSNYLYILKSCLSNIYFLDTVNNNISLQILLNKIIIKYVKEMRIIMNNHPDGKDELENQNPLNIYYEDSIHIDDFIINFSEFINDILLLNNKELYLFLFHSQLHSEDKYFKKIFNNLKEKNISDNIAHIFSILKSHFPDHYQFIRANIDKENFSVIEKAMIIKESMGEESDIYSKRIKRL